MRQLQPDRLLHPPAPAGGRQRAQRLSGCRGRQAIRRQEVPKVRFAANDVAVDDSDDNFILVGFADEQDGRYRDSLYFQLSYEFDEQDVALGMDQVYFERNGQSQGAYGGIERVELHIDRVRIVVRGQPAQPLGDSEFEIGLSLAAEEFGRLR